MNSFGFYLIVSLLFLIVIVSLGSADYSLKKITSGSSKSIRHFLRLKVVW
jgi:hypothetical protein